MDLLRLLGVNPRKLPPDAAEAVHFCRAVWEEYNNTCDSVSLKGFLDDALSRCAGIGLRHPKVFLLRLKQLQRGEWRPDGQGWHEEHARASIRYTKRARTG